MMAALEAQAVATLPAAQETQQVAGPEDSWRREWLPTHHSCLEKGGHSCMKRSLIGGSVSAETPDTAEQLRLSRPCYKINEPSKRNKNVDWGFPHPDITTPKTNQTPQTLKYTKKPQTKHPKH